MTTAGEYLSRCGVQGSECGQVAESRVLRCGYLPEEQVDEAGKEGHASLRWSSG